MKKNILHKHILIRGEIYKAPTANDIDSMKEWLTNFVSKIGMKIIQGPFVSYVEAEGNRGMTGCVMIETSHIAFHIWDEKSPGLMQFDLYTCSELNVPTVLRELEKKFDFSSYEYMVFDRAETFKLIQGSYSE